jgi:hypothetical protein
MERRLSVYLPFRLSPDLKEVNPKLTAYTHDSQNWGAGSNFVNSVYGSFNFCGTFVTRLRSSRPS